jgi:hypothetical protein
MSFTFQGPTGSFERRWIVYAMFRDNVQHHLENGEVSEAFRELHQLGNALVQGRVSVPAPELRREIQRSLPLLERSIDDLAVSVKTRSIQMLRLPLPAISGTTLASEIGWEAPFPLEGALTLSDAFGSLVAELLRITEGAKDGDLVTVIDS